MKYFICLGSNFEDFKEGLKGKNLELVWFYEQAFHEAKSDEVELYIEGVVNSCDHRFVHFKSTNQITNGFFQKNQIHLYVDCINEIFSYKNSFLSCKIYLYTRRELREELLEKISIFDSNEIVFVDYIRNNYLNSLPIDFARFNFDILTKKHLRANKLLLNQNEDLFKEKLLIFVDSSCIHSTAKCIDNISSSIQKQDIVILNIGNYSLPTDRLHFNEIDIINAADQFISTLSELLLNIKCALYLGVGNEKYYAYFRILNTYAIPLIANKIIYKKFDITPCVAMQIANEINGTQYNYDLIIQFFKHPLVHESDFAPPKQNLDSNSTMPQKEPTRHPIANNADNSLYSFCSRESDINDELFVLWLGRFDFIGGYGTVARGYLDAMEAVGIKNLCVDINSLSPVGKSTGAFWQNDKKNRRFVLPKNTVLIINDTPMIFGKFKASGFLTRIGCTIFETDSFPINWLDGLKFIDELWVPTQFNYNTFAYGGIPQNKMSIIPYSIDINYFSQTNTSDKQKTNFLYILSNMNRKDPGLLLRAYYKAFTAKDKVCLIIKTRMTEEKLIGFLNKHFLHPINLNDPSLPEVKIISGTISNDALRKLYQDTDFYVTTERAKGWDYPAMEAMCMGIPTICLDWSGSEFLTQNNAYLIPVKHNYVRVHSSQVDNAEMYFAHKWPDVDENEVIKYLKMAYTEQHLKLSKSKQCVIDVQQYSPENIGRKIKQQLDLIRINRNHKKNSSFTNSYLYY